MCLENRNRQLCVLCFGWIELSPRKSGIYTRLPSSFNEFLGFAVCHTQYRTTNTQWNILWTLPSSFMRINEMENLLFLDPALRQLLRLRFPIALVHRRIKLARNSHLCHKGDHKFPPSQSDKWDSKAKHHVFVHVHLRLRKKPFYEKGKCREKFSGKGECEVEEGDEKNRRWWWWRFSSFRSEKVFDIFQC